MSNTKERLFDIDLFKRLFAYTKPYRFVFFGLLVVVLITGLLSISVPYFLEKVIDEKIAPKIEEGFLELIILMLSLVVLKGSIEVFWM